MKIIGKLLLLILIPTVFIGASLSVLFWLGEREEAEALAEAMAAQDADLVVEQYVTEDNDVSGLVYAKNEMHWDRGKLTSMRFTQRYATNEQAISAYQGKAATLGASTQLMLNDCEVSYYLSTEDFKEISYEAMREAMGSGSGWQIVEELSGEYAPVGEFTGLPDE